MKEKTFNRLKKIAKFLGTAAILGVADSLGGSATVSVGENNRKYWREEEAFKKGVQYEHSEERAIDDISDAVKNIDGDYFKCNAADQIAKIVRTSDDTRLKYYAASKIANIADSIESAYFQARVIDIATKLVGG